MKLTYKHTAIACYISYITSAVINNLTSLLFVTFQREFGLTLDQLAFLIVMNFGVQIFVDFIGAKFADRIGYRRIVMASHVFAAAGLVFLAFLPKILPSAFIGLIISAFTYAVGSGLMEVIISPITEALPSEAKASSMSFMHSFYCWGCVLVAVVSTLFFKFAGIENWSVLCLIWALLPVSALFLFKFVPINQLCEGEEKKPLTALFRTGVMWLFMILMACSGAAEQSMAQWASYFAETELGVTKQTADLLGPCTFAIAMGISRVAFAKITKKIDMKICLLVSGILCIVSYAMTAFIPYSYLSLAGCALCGLSVGAMWPGVLSLSAETNPSGGTSMFAILALCGDVGCFSGPEAIARAASAFSADGEPSVKAGLSVGIVFPLVIVAAVLFLMLLSKRKSGENFAENSQMGK